MEWYWWVLIAAGVIVIGALKLMVWNRIMQKRKDKKQRMEQDE